ncbi:MAG: prenyltransferase [Dehalococcoidia bacterium]|nr:prenyltransferase [Dehalococcoidia bacterium]
MTTTAARPFAPRLWLEALYTIPRVDLAHVDPITRWLILSRASVVVMTATSAVIGGLLALRDDVFDAPLLILTALGLVLAHAGSNLVNDFWDFHRGADSADSPRVNYGPHPLTDESARWRSFLLVTLFILAAAAAIGIYLTLVTGPVLLAFALSGAFVLLLYSGGPLPLKYFGLGEIAVFIVWGPLMIGGTYYVMAESLPGWVVLASVPYALGVTTVLFGKHLDKLAFDTEHGIRTLPMLLGEARARRLTEVLSVGMYAAVIALAVWQEMPGLLLVVGALPMLLWVLRIYNAPKPAEPPEGYHGWPLWFVGIAFIHNRRFGVLFIAGLALQLAAEAVL